MPHIQVDLSAPQSPSLDRIETIELAVPNGTVEVIDDPYSDRIRCDHPDIEDPKALGERLEQEARSRGRGRVVAFVEARHAAALEDVGYEIEAVMPGFYEGEADCVTLGASADPGRMLDADRSAALETKRILREKQGSPGLHMAVETEQASVDDATAIAELLDETFVEYPTPTGDGPYIASQMEAGNIFRVVRRAGEIVACASADLVKQARTAELTDCATRLEYRGKGFMREILNHLMRDLVAMRYPTAFTLARARVPGVNVAFQRCGFELRGRMAKSCRIGTGLEDMNVWSRHL